MKLLQHFKELTIRPKNTKELKGLILQLAIQGKLTANWREENQDIELASELLNRIQKEKEQLVKDKKIKKEKPIPALKNSDVPFKLPKSWVWCSLSDIGIIGSSSRVHKKDWQTEGVPFYRAREIVKLSKFGSVENSLFITEELFDKYKKTGSVPEENDIMITGVGTIGIPYVVKEKDKFYFKDASVLIFRNMFNLYSKYLELFFSCQYWIDEIHKNSMGTTVHTLTISRAKIVPTIFPPLEEQKEIVKVVETLFKEVEQLEQLTVARIGLKEDFVTSALQQLTTNNAKQEWDFLQDHFKSFFNETTNIKKLRETVLQLAVQGKLTADWRTQNSPASRTQNSPQEEGCPEGGVVNNTQPPIKRNSKNYFSLPFNPKLKQRAKDLRKAGNLSEVLFWNEVKRGQFKGLDFDRQKNIGNYIVDFYCPNHQVVIEIDGSSHDEKQDYDAKRDAYLTALGLTVIHIEDSAIKTQLKHTINWLHEHEALQPPRPADTPPKEGNWEHASELLKRIQKEKAQLIKDKKIKKEKPLPKITKEEIPYDLPEGWVWCRLQDLVNVGTGSTPATSNSSYYGGEIPWYTSSATNDLFAKESEKLITEKALKETNCKVFSAGTLIIAMYGQGKTRGQISELVIPGATNQAVAAMVFYKASKDFKEYIKYFFRKIYDEIRLLAEGGAQPNLNVGKIKNTIIPFPPLEEQKAIVQKVNALMGLCDVLEQEVQQSQEYSEQLMQSVLRAIFEGSSK